MHTYTPLRKQLELLQTQATANSRRNLPHFQEDYLHVIENQLKAWLLAMSPQERSRRFMTAEIIALAQLHGKRGPTPGDRMVAQALRNVGFTPHRDWTVAGRNKRYWTLIGNES
jgi:hypothetical protein